VKINSFRKKTPTFWGGGNKKNILRVFPFSVSNLVSHFQFFFYFFSPEKTENPPEAFSTKIDLSIKNTFPFLLEKYAAHF
jgi:hypothetical protein